MSDGPPRGFRPWAMLDLRDDDLPGPILDCPGGAGDLGATVRAAGGAATSVDPLDALPREEVVERAREGTLRGNRDVDQHRDLSVWSFFGSVEDHRERRLGAPERFAADPSADGVRYLAAASPACPSSPATAVGAAGAPGGASGV